VQQEKIADVGHPVIGAFFPVWQRSITVGVD
jgi:hypothetical protein